MKFRVDYFVFCCFSLFFLCSCDELTTFGEASCSDIEVKFQKSFAAQGELTSSDSGSPKPSMAIVLNEDGVGKILPAHASYRDTLNIKNGTSSSSPTLYRVSFDSTTVKLGLNAITLDNYKNADWSVTRGSRQHNNLKKRLDEIATQVFLEVPFRVQRPSTLNILCDYNDCKALLSATQVYGRAIDGKYTYSLKVGDLIGLKITSSFASETVMYQIANEIGAFLQNKKAQNIKLFDFDAWAIGGKKVKLTAIADLPKLSPDNQSLTFGFYTNLKGTVDAELKLAQKLGTDSTFGVYMHPKLISSMIAFLIKEKKIEGEIELTSAQTSGKMGVTIPDEPAIAVKSNSFELPLRIWSYKGNLCGFVDIAVTLKPEVENQKFSFSVPSDGIRTITPNDKSFLSKDGLSSVGKSKLLEEVIKKIQELVNYKEIRLVDRNNNLNTVPNLYAQSFNLSSSGNDGTYFFFKIQKP